MNAEARTLSGTGLGRPGRYWRLEADGRIRCELCPRYCRLRDGQRGLCFVRARAGEQLYLSTYGRSTGLCIDPIEKKPLNHFLPGSPVLSLGTAGCNLACKFCQNWDTTRSREVDRRQTHASPEDVAEAALASGCRGVAFTYNDPIIFLEYAVDTARACRERGIRTLAVTNGYVTQAPREEFFRHMDAANIDLKAFTEQFYRKICGGHLEPVLETIRYLKAKTEVWFEITNLLIPGLNDDDREIDAMTRWLCDTVGPDVPLHFTAFHPDWKMLDVPPTPAKTLTRCREHARANGLHYVYTGNVRDARGASTYCRGCGEVLVRRDGYRLSHWRIEAADGVGRCRRCSTVLPGVYESRPGGWGDRRRPLAVH